MKRKGLCPCCGKKPKAGFLRCEACLAKQRAYDRAWREKQKAAWREKQKGGAVEPSCKPSSGAMRVEHDFDEEIGVCRVCGAKRMAFAPPPARPIAAVEAKARPGKGGSRKATPRARAGLFEGRSFIAAPKPEPTRTPDMIDAIERAAVGDDAATIPDPLAAAIAALELERDEITIAIETLRRLRGRKAMA